MLSKTTFTASEVGSFATFHGAIHGSNEFAPAISAHSHTTIELMSPGFHGRLAKFPRALIYKGLVTGKSATLLEMDSSWIALIIPLRWDVGVRLNGQEPSILNAYTMPEGSEICVAGGARESIMIAVQSTDFHQAVASLAGFSKKECPFDLGHVHLAPLDRQMLLAFCTAILHSRQAPEICEKHGHQAGQRLLSLVAEICVKNLPAQKQLPKQLLRQKDLIHRVLTQAETDSTVIPSIYELCRLIGASKSVLYSAFDEILGMSPRNYLLHRRLSMARHELLTAEPSRNSVTGIAISHGFYELGRFSQYYRRVFEESPRDTLQQRANWQECETSGKVGA